MKIKIAIHLIVAIAACGGQWVRGAETRVENLRCEGVENPMGIDAAKPQLSWRLESDERGQKQTACQILVASSADKLAHDEGDLWDSGRVGTDQSARLPYAGKALGARAECYWKVRVWDAHKKPTAWSAPARWTMGLLAPEDWKGAWITASKWFAPCGYGWETPALSKDDAAAWARVDLGQAFPIDKVKLIARDAESFPVRFRIEASDDFDFTTSHAIADCSAADYTPESDGTAEFPGKSFKARFLRILVLKSPLSKLQSSRAAEAAKKSSPPATSGQSAPSTDRYQTGLRQLEVWSGGGPMHYANNQLERWTDGRNVALYRPTSDSGGNESAFFLVDGMPSADMGKTCPADACPRSQAPLLRKAFTLDKPVKRAVLSYAAPGMAELSLNGTRVDDTLLGPPFTDYTKRIVYRTVEVTRLLAGGSNVLGAVLGNGFLGSMRGLNGGPGQPRLLAQLDLEFMDGTRQQVVTDQTWKWAPSEIIDNNIWGSYAEDRRLAQPGWDKPGFDDAKWRAVGLGESLGGKLCAVMGPPARVLGQIKPSRVEGDTAYFDVLSAGWPRLTIDHGKAGQEISFHGDHGMPTCRFILAQDGPAVLEPRFIWGSGPLKLQVKGLTEPLRAEQVCIQRVGADLRLASAFHCSNPFLNQLHEGVLRTHLNYNVDQPMDPMREKVGWTQDAEGFFNTAVYLTDVDNFYRKWWWDMADNQVPNGLTGPVIPMIGRLLNGWNCPWWSGVLVWLPWEHYLYYGDRRLLEQAYEPMRKYVDYLDRLAAIGGGTKPLDYPDPQRWLDAQAAKERMLVWTGAGDWMRPTADGPPDQLLNMTAWYHYAQIVSQTAAMLGKPDEAARYTAMAEDIRQRTNAKFLDPKTGLYGKNPRSQSGQILPLALGLVPEAVRPLTQQRLIDAIHAQKDHHACGFVSLTYLFQTLTESYESTLANRIVNQNDYPSWKTLMHDGVLFENWKGEFAQMPSCGGSVGRWLYEAVLGIRPDPAGPGFKRFILAPQPDPATGLTSAEGWYDCLYGRIVSRWKIEGDKFDLEITVPANTMATVRIPTSKPEAVKEGGQPVEESAGVKVLRREPQALFLEVGSGRYRFDAPAPAQSANR